MFQPHTSKVILEAPCITLTSENCHRREGGFQALVPFLNWQSNQDYLVERSLLETM